MFSDMEKGIIHRQDVCRFEKTVDGHIAHVAYEIHDGHLNVIRTYVPQPLRGQGIASELVEAAFEFADEEGLGRYATCSYASAWLARHH